MTQKLCAYEDCRAPFTPTNPCQKYCHPLCQTRAKEQRRLDRLKERGLVPNKYQQRLCEYCEEPYTPRGWRQKYCSTECNRLDEQETMQMLNRRAPENKSRTCRCGTPTDNYRCDECWAALLYNEEDSYEAVDYRAGLRMGG